MLSPSTAPQPQLSPPSPSRRGCIYLDGHATTPVDPRVLETMLPFFSESFGNPASRTHVYGWRAEEAVERARGEIAGLLGVNSKEVIFTSGATESNNLAIFGTAGACREQGNHLVTSAIEHHSVLGPFRQLEKQGFQVTYLQPSRTGAITAAQVAGAITPRTILVSIMAAHNEIGTIYPLAEIARACAERRIRFHTDAAQAVGKIPLEVPSLGIDLLSLTGHKLYGPKGTGALVIRTKSPRLQLQPLIHGGGHERGLRSGTLNVPGIVGLGAACRIAREEMEGEARRLRGLRDRLHQGICSQLEDLSLNGHPERRLPGNLNLSFGGVEGESLIVSLRDIAVSSGAACTSAKPEPSYVLKAIGLDSDRAHSSLRFGLGRFTTAEEIEYVIKRVVETVKRLRDLASAVKNRGIPDQPTSSDH
ncbi:MAG: aminotransferase class V-fold PLP-dependent enzyme [Planctomycetes bacterium]|nr:aminotransferase class V-fold PLP-dependent enzyme [Planctomycetota bacterium]